MQRQIYTIVVLHHVPSPAVTFISRDASIFRDPHLRTNTQLRLAEKKNKTCHFLFYFISYKTHAKQQIVRRMLRMMYEGSSVQPVLA